MAGRKSDSKLSLKKITVIVGIGVGVATILATLAGFAETLAGIFRPAKPAVVTPAEPPPARTAAGKGPGDSIQAMPPSGPQTVINSQGNDNIIQGEVHGDVHIGTPSNP